MCGLFGWIGDDSKDLNTKVITILGLYNQARGTDAVGILSPTSVEKSIVNGKFNEFIEKDLFYESLVTDSTNFILGHTRNASPGTTKSIDNAQPVAYLNKKNDINFGLIHNGSIKNTSELLKENNLESTNLSDSYDIAKVLFNTSRNKLKNVLSSYIGKAALVWVDSKNQDIIYMFRGASKLYSYSKDVSDERPLFIYKEKGNNSIYFSSLMNGFEAAFPDGDPKNITKLEPNTIYVFNKGKLKQKITVDRSGSSQEVAYKQQYSYPRQNYNTNAYTRNNNSYKQSLSKNVLTSKKGYGFISLKNGRYCYNDKLLNGYYGINKLGKFVQKDDINRVIQFYKVLFFEGYIITTFDEFSFERKKDSLLERLQNTEALSDMYHARIELSSFTNMPIIEPSPAEIVASARINQEFANNTYTYLFMQLKVGFDNGGLKSISKINIPFKDITYSYGYVLKHSNFNEMVTNTNKLLNANTSTELILVDKQTKAFENCKVCKGTGIINEFKGITCLNCGGTGLIDTTVSNINNNVDIDEKHTEEDEIEYNLQLEFVDEYVSDTFSEIDENIESTLVLLKESLDLLDTVKKTIEFVEGFNNPKSNSDMINTYRKVYRDYHKRLTYTKNTLVKLIKNESTNI